MFYVLLNVDHTYIKSDLLNSLFFLLRLWSLIMDQINVSFRWKLFSFISFCKFRIVFELWMEIWNINLLNTRPSSILGFVHARFLFIVLFCVFRLAIKQLMVHCRVRSNMLSSDETLQRLQLAPDSWIWWLGDENIVFSYNNWIEVDVFCFGCIRSGILSRLQLALDSDG